MGKKRKRRKSEERSFRYWEVNIPVADLSAELAARERALTQQLEKQPNDVALWLRFIDFQEAWRGPEAGLRAAERGAAECGEGECGEGEAGRAVRAARHRARAAHLDTHQLLRVLQQDAHDSAARAGPQRLEAWVRLLQEAGARGGAARGARHLQEALDRLRPLPPAYPHLLYVYGSYLSDAGLWEQLVLLMELVAAMNFPPAGFPPPPDPDRDAALEKQLHEFEDKVMGSGLPQHVVWARIERARGAAHWRPPAAPPALPLGADADPQRYPVAADVAALLLPVADPQHSFMLCVNLLRLAKVPLLPGAEYVERACGPAGLAAEESGGAGRGGAESLLPALRAARRLPPHHPARRRAAHAPDLVRLLLDPPHYFTDDAGYLSWVNSLWEACLSWTSGSRRLALLCWRLRWMHSLMLLLDPETESGAAECGRMRREARGVLARWAGEHALPYVLLAPLEPRYGPRALRAALAPACPPAVRLYAARGAGGGARGAVCAAVLGRREPCDPDATTLQLAYEHCAERCAELEKRWTEEGCEERDGAECALLPCEGAEWGAARVSLASPAQRRDILRDVLHYSALPNKSASHSRYCEQTACALAAGGAAGQLAPLFPHNVYIQLAARGAGAALSVPRPVTSHAAALARALPALLAALRSRWEPPDAERAYRACGAGGAGGAAGAAGGAGGAALGVCRLEAAPHCARPRTARALLAALDLLPAHKWVYVRGAAWGGAAVSELADALLHRELRLHTLLAELQQGPADST